nr:unnamed protein product [Spirometra erinaceieuropaei]
MVRGSQPWCVVIAILVALPPTTPVSFHVTEKEKSWGCQGDREIACCPGDCRQVEFERPEFYSCSCADTHYAMRTFDPTSAHLITTKCISRRENYCVICHPSHTYACTEIPDKKSAVCHCLPEYSTETRCFQLKNACTDTTLGSTKNGNETCRVEEGNLCFPEPGTHRYTCVCAHPHRALSEKSFPNCMASPEHACERYLCVGFQPRPHIPTLITPRLVTIATGRRDSLHPNVGQCVAHPGVHCQCPTNWYGPHCTIHRGHPEEATWSPWSNCRPDCIDPRDGYRAHGVGFLYTLASCSTQEKSVCTGKFKIWRRCKVTLLCTLSQPSEQFSPEVTRALSKAMKLDAPVRFPLSGRSQSL